DELVEKAVQREMRARGALKHQLEAARKEVDDLKMQNKAVVEMRQALHDRFKAQLLEKAQTDAQGQIALLKELIGYKRQYKADLERRLRELLDQDKAVKHFVFELQDSQVDLDQAAHGVTTLAEAIDKLQVEL